jgi:hypothetical protein
MKTTIENEKKNNNNYKKKHNEGLKPWSLHLKLNKVTHELIDPQTNNILLITWG